jgi:hypothetical protein
MMCWAEKLTLNLLLPDADIPVHCVARTTDAWQLSDEPALSKQPHQPSIEGIAAGSCGAAGTALD